MGTLGILITILVLSFILFIIGMVVTSKSAHNKFNRSFDRKVNIAIGGVITYFIGILGMNVGFWGLVIYGVGKILNLI